MRPVFLGCALCCIASVVSFKPVSMAGDFPPERSSADDSSSRVVYFGFNGERGDATKAVETTVGSPVSVNLFATGGTGYSWFLLALEPGKQDVKEVHHVWTSEELLSLRQSTMTSDGISATQPAILSSSASSPLMGSPSVYQSEITPSKRGAFTAVYGYLRIWKPDDIDFFTLSIDVQ